MLRSFCEVTEDVVWHTTLKIDGYAYGYDALKCLVLKCIASQQQCALVVTVSPDKTFVIMFDKKGNQALFDSHTHYTAVPQEQSFEQASSVWTVGRCTPG